MTSPVRDHATEFVDADEALRLEDTLWWWRGRRSILRTFLDRARRERPLSRILEIGCGSGGHLDLLAEYGEVVAVERSPTLAERARSRAVASAVHAADFLHADLPGDFDLACLFDVLEHIEDDAAFLLKLARAAAPGQLLLLSVPACPFLYGPHDALLHHYRRYTRRGLERLLEESGYTVLRGGYFLFFLFPVAVLSRFKERLLARLGRTHTRVELGVVPGWLNRVLTGVLRLEALLSRFVAFPIGVWFIVLARKR